MTTRIICLILLVCSVSAIAKPTKTQADSLYSHHLYEQAAKSYEELLKSHPRDARLLYNLGNSYYRLKQIPHAILCYERAAKINPSDADNRHNLTLSRALTEDKFYSSTDLDIVYSFNSFVNTFGADGWAWMSVLALFICLAAVLLMRFSVSSRIKKVSFIFIVLMGGLVIVCNVFAMVQRNKFHDHSAAIVMQTTRLLSTPDTTGTNLFTLHGGTKVSLKDTTLPSWTEVTLADGRRGWVQNKDIAGI